MGANPTDPPANRQPLEIPPEQVAHRLLSMYHGTVATSRIVSAPATRSKPVKRLRQSLHLA